MNTKIPTTLLEAITYFSDEQVAFEFVKKLRWHGDSVICPHCGGKEPSFISTRGLWKCKECRKQFSVKVGTIFEDSPINFSKWLCAIWMIANCKNGVSSYEIHRALGVTQKTAWFMLHRIRFAMQQGSIDKLADHVEVDETYIGGKARNMHKHVKERKIKGTGGKDKTVVMGMLERGGYMVTRVIERPKKHTLHSLIKSNVVSGSNVYTDALRSYSGLNEWFDHQVIDHATNYVEGNVHTNGLENFWSLLKRTIGGTYVSVEPFHLFRYLDEQAFRFNNRHTKDHERFMSAVSGVVGKKLTYNRLVGRELAARV